MQSKPLKIFIIILVVIVAISIFYIYQTRGRNLGLTIESPSEALIGVPFDLKIEVSNQSGSILKDVFLTLSLPNGAALVGQRESESVVNKNFGNLGKGSLISETYQVVFLSGKDSAKKIRAVVSYLPASLGARFEKIKDVEILIRDAGVVIEMIGPESVFSGEEFEMEVIYRNISEMDFSNLELKLEYPANFSFISSTVAPDKGKNTWMLGDLYKGSEGTFSIKGSIIGPEESSVEFKPILQTTLSGKNYDLEMPPFGLMIAPSPLSLAIALNGESEYVAKAGESLDYVISYVNDTDVALRGVVIRAQLIGEMFDFNHLNADAFFRSVDNTLIWNSQNTPNLNILSSNSAGFVRFSIRTKSNYPIKRFSDKDFLLKVDAEIESPTVPKSIEAAKTFNMAKLETKVSGNIIIETLGYFRDAPAGILNSGPMPPKVGQPTNFTIHWRLKNFATNVSNVEVRAVLREGVKFIGTAKSSFGPPPFYDDKNNQMVWQIDRLSANRGVVDQPLEAIFQIEATPSAGQVAKYMPLIGATNFKAYDDFIGLDIAGVSAPISTALPNDVTVGAQGGVVQP